MSEVALVKCNKCGDMCETDRPHLCEDVPVQCINGSCPMALSDEYEERGMDVVHNCSECQYREDKEQKSLIKDSPKLAQELVQDTECCEWEVLDNIIFDSYKTDCFHEFNTTSDIREFRYCPYCGRMIKVV